MKKLILGIALSSMSLSVMAGDKGNGGDILICKNDKNYLLDVYEGRTHGFYSKIKVNEDDSVDKMISQWSSHLIDLDPERSKNYREKALNLSNELEKAKNGKSSVVTFTTDELIDIDDSNEIFIPENCKKKQLVIQLNVADTGALGKKFIVNQNYWNMLDDEQKAFTILHEVIYTDAIKMGHTNSRKVRELNYIVGADEFKTALTKKEYIKTMLEHFNLTYKFDTNLSISELELKPSDLEFLNFNEDDYIVAKFSFDSSWAYSVKENKIWGKIETKTLCKATDGNYSRGSCYYKNNEEIAYKSAAVANTSSPAIDYSWYLLDLNDDTTTIDVPKKWWLGRRISYVTHKESKVRGRKLSMIKIKDGEIIEIK